MNVIPAIDLMDGRCVQLIQGDPKTRKIYGDPVEKAVSWVDAGASMLHIIDLDATLGLGNNLETLKALKKAVDVPIEFGGGIRTVEKARNILGFLGEKDRIIVGTLAVADYPGFTVIDYLKDEKKKRIIVSVDSKQGYVAVKGWQEKSMLKAPQLMRELSDKVWGYLYTNVDVEGLMRGVDEDTVKDVTQATKNPVIVSGGITTKDDLRICEDSGAWGVVIGKALL